MSRIRKLLRIRFGLFTLLMVGLLSVVGCTGTLHPVTGKVTFLNGDPVPGGTIYFTRYDYATTYNPDGTVAHEYVTPEITSATIGSDGTYSTNLGESYTYTVTLTNGQAPTPGPIPTVYAYPNVLSYYVYPNPDGTYTYNVSISN
jgi:hypothetical protein